MNVQAPSAVLMIRPHHFRPNPETAADNAFQGGASGRDPEAVALAAHAEVTAAALALRSAGVTVHLFEDLGADLPDSVFPNNWISTHPDGRVVLHPMYPESRRGERRMDVVRFLEEHYRVTEVIDDSGLEREGRFLEGTGAMVIDHVAGVAYAARSNRADPVALERFCARRGYEPFVFDSVDEGGVAIYHTNVMMAVGTEVALVGVETVADERRRRELVGRLVDSGRIVVELSFAQVRSFAGNVIELTGSDGQVLALSERARGSLRDDQVEVIEGGCRLLPLAVPTLELSGGSVRCTIAGIHLEPR